MFLLERVRVRAFCAGVRSLEVSDDKQAAMKRVIAWQIEQEMKAQNLTKTRMAAKMNTSRAALNRLLDQNDTSLTLTTLASAANALGKKFRFELAS